MYLFFIYNKTRIENLLTELTKIRWNPKDFTENFLASDQKFQKRIAFATCSFTIHSAILVHVFMLRPALQGSLYILETWEPESFVLATIVLALQYYLFLLLPTTIMTFDCLYLALCAEIVTQVRRLQYKMRRLFRDPVDSVRTRNEVCYLVRCHDHLLR